MYTVAKEIHHYDYHSVEAIATFPTKAEADKLAAMMNAKETYNQTDGFASVTHSIDYSSFDEYIRENCSERFDIYPNEEERDKHFRDFNWSEYSYNPYESDIFDTMQERYSSSTLLVNPDYRYWEGTYYPNGYPRKVPGIVIEPEYSDEYL